MLRKGWGVLLALPLLTLTSVLLAAAEEGHAEGNPLINEPDSPVIPSTVWGILVFVTVLAILWKKAFPPITEALDKRARLIRESLEAAERAKKEAEALIAKHEESLEKGRAEARAIIEEGKADALEVKERIVGDAKKESQELVARARREIELAKQEAIEGLHQRAVDLSLDLASRILQKNLKAEDHRELIQTALRKFQEVR
jgi:F-type H+-transporting ATPase subunit b